MEAYASSQRFSTMFRLSISIFHGGDAQPRGINRMYISRPFHSLNVLFCLALFGHLTGPSGPWALGRQGGRCFCFGPSIHGVAVTRPRDNRDMNLLFFSLFEWRKQVKAGSLLTDLFYFYFQLLIRQHPTLVRFCASANGWLRLLPIFDQSSISYFSLSGQQHRKAFKVFQFPSIRLLRLPSYFRQI